MMLAEAPVSADFVMLPIGRLLPSPDNPRQVRGDVSELAASIETVGVLQPLLVMPLPDERYRIVCGERRWAAATQVGLTWVPCIVRDLTERERQEAMLIENLQRSNLSKLEEAQAFRRLLEMGFTQRVIAARVGKSQSHISRRLLLLALPRQVREQVDQGAVPVDQALGYRAAPPSDVFAADEELQRAWMAVRQHVIDTGDRKLLRLVRDFATAFARCEQLRSTNGNHRRRPLMTPQ